ncbi:MAG: hypothetical protein IJP92_04840 [Lachnospiraceae bacterium]|nr:hypothetical protein [Lachnospiraceae bacterium]
MHQEQQTEQAVRDAMRAVFEEDVSRLDAADEDERETVQLTKRQLSDLSGRICALPEEIRDLFFSKYCFDLSSDAMSDLLRTDYPSGRLRYYEDLLSSVILSDDGRRISTESFRKAGRLAWKQYMKHTKQRTGAQKVSVKAGRRLLPWAAAAVIFLAGCGTAIAVMLYSQRTQQITDTAPLQGTYTVHQLDGTEVERVEWNYEGPGLAFTWEGINEDSVRYIPEFRAGYLPDRPTVSPLKQVWDEFYKPEKGWHIIQERDEWWLNGEIPYRISIFFPDSDVHYVLSGDCEIISEEQRGNLQVTRVRVETTDDRTWSEENHIILFDRENGHGIHIAGTLPLEELRHIEEELEIRLSDVVFEPPFADIPMENIYIYNGEQILTLNLGRG